MTVSSFHFEAKKHAYRQTQDGIVVSFVVHPNDVNAALAVAPLGTRYMVAVAEVGDDGRPIDPEAVTSTLASQDTGERPSMAASDAGPPRQEKASASGPKRQKTLPELVGMRCNDERFQDWAKDRHIYGDALDIPTFVRNYCGVTSRKEILPGTDAAEMWLSLETQYLTETGQMAERR